MIAVPLTPDADVTACMHRAPPHGMGDPVLDGYVQELVFMLPPECFGEHSPDLLDHSAFARPWRSMAKTQQGLLGGRTLRVTFCQLEPLFFEPEFL